MIDSVTFLCCATAEELEGALLVNYWRNGEPFSRFYGEFFGKDDKTGESRFSLVKGYEHIYPLIVSIINDISHSEEK